MNAEVTRDEAIGAAARSLAEAMHQALYIGTIEEAVERAYTPSGPSREVLATRIRRLRAERAGEEAA